MSGRLACVLALALAAQALAAQAGAAEPQPSDPNSPVAALIERWSGVHDSAEQVILGDSATAVLAQESSVRISTLVAPVSLPWLGPEVLYLEEFAHDDPDSPRRIVLLRLEAQAEGEPGAVQVRVFTFRSPSHWRRLYADATLAAALHREDLDAVPGCDLTLVRDGDQFRGGTAGRGCLATSGAPPRYVDYRLLIGSDLYWYRKRLKRVDDDELVQETVGFEWFELHRARLFACRVRWSATGQPEGLAPVTVVDLHDQGGRARFTTPDGHGFELELHSNDWPFDVNRDALMLVVREAGAAAPLASSWAEVGANEIGVNLEAMDVRCGPLAPSRAQVSF